MKYKQIASDEVLSYVAKGITVYVCEIESQHIDITDYMVVEDIRNFISHENIVFLVADNG